VESGLAGVFEEAFERGRGGICHGHRAIRAVCLRFEAKAFAVPVYRLRPRCGSRSREARIGLVVFHPSHKNKDAARAGHPMCGWWLFLKLRLFLPIKALRVSCAEE
jgi:hypothetical protein